MRESHNMVDLKPNTDGFIQGVIVVAWNKRQDSFPVWKLKGIKEVSAAKVFLYNFCLQTAVVVVHHIVRTKKHAHQFLGIFFITATVCQGQASQKRGHRVITLTA